MRGAIERHRSLNRALDSLPPADEGRPVSLRSRERRNANRYISRSKRNHGIGALDDATRVCLAVLAQSPRLISTAELGSLLAQRDSSVSVIDVRDDFTRYLESHIRGRYTSTPRSCAPPSAACEQAAWTRVVPALSRGWASRPTGRS